MNFVDKALARRFESAEEMPQVEYARIYQKIRPEIGAAEEEICGGHMIFAGLNSPIGRAVGMGFSGPVTAADLDRLENFYRVREAPAQLDYCPLTDASVLELTKERKYGIAELNNLHFLPLTNLPSFAMPEGVVIRPGVKEQATELSNIVTQSFFEKGDAPEGFQDLITPMFAFPGAITYGVTIDGTLVAAAAGLVIPEHRIFALFGAGTLPAYRGRGIQTALLRTRMQAAHDAGCEFAVVVTQGGTTSERNCLRLGFRTAYSKATLIKNFSGSTTGGKTESSGSA
jgi:ribosomal protein S18 acetylase RimI-like enzyme